MDPYLKFCWVQYIERVSLKQTPQKPLQRDTTTKSRERANVMRGTTVCLKSAIKIL